jgi:hypothetical protein
MPAPFTHQFICGEGMARVDRGEGFPAGLRQLLNQHYQFVYLGSESPDLPYLSFTGGTNWADLMHYEQTNSLVVHGFEALRQRWTHKTPADEVKLAWLFGHASHMIADAAIHPIVNAIVGPYQAHAEEHRLCEMTMDSLLFHELSGSELGYANWSDYLEFCGQSPHFKELLEFWKEQLLASYPNKPGAPYPGLWFTTYTAAIDGAEDEEGVAGIFRHLGLGKKYLYQTAATIRRDSPNDARDYYDQVKLPTGLTGPFKKEGFDKAVGHVVDAWAGMYQGLTSLGLDVAMIIRNWNLDTGVDMDNIQALTFWGEA